MRRLDNRPRSIAVVFPNGEEMGPEKDEALRQYLLFVSLSLVPLHGLARTVLTISQSDLMETTQITSHPSRSDAAVLAFAERFQAEKFIGHATEIPHIGKVELTWMPNAAPAPVAMQPAADSSKDVNMDESQDLGPPRPVAEMDYDVADDDDSWLN